VTLSVTLQNRGDGTGSGVLQGHPASPEVVTRRDRDGRLHLTLLEGGEQIGSGLLVARLGQWQGRCSEWAGTWFVSGRCGAGTLVFSEKAPPDRDRPIGERAP
jgi:hypothetical protein